jgi:hypothetical protein
MSDKESSLKASISIEIPEMSSANADCLTGVRSIILDAECYSLESGT